VGKTRNLTLREISEHRVLVPPELAETGMSLIVLVGLDGRLQPGLVPSDQVPVSKPIQDLTRLQRARAVVSSLDAAASKMSVVSEIKEQVISAALSSNLDPKKVDLKLGAQSELIKSKTLALAVQENRDLFQACPQNKVAVYRSTAAKWFENTISSINTYVLDSQCCNQAKDLPTILLENHVPKWFFNKFTVGKVQELATNCIDDILFPKKLSRMITFTEKELLSDRFIENSIDFKIQLISLRRIVDLYPSQGKEATLFPMPNDFSRRFSSFSDLPQIDRTTHQSSILSLTLIHMVYCAIPIKALTVENLKLHLDSLIFESKDIKPFSGETALPEQFEKCETSSKKPDDFRFVPEMSTSAKVQYKDFLSTEGMTRVIGFRFIRQFYSIFNITDIEIKTLEPGILFDFNSGSRITSSAETIFRLYPPEITNNQKRSAFADAFSVLKPAQPKELNFGQPNSPLTHESEKFLKNLTSAKFNIVFLSNVKKFLQSFNNPVFQAQAIKIMHATLQARTVTLTEPPEGPDESDSEGQNPYENFS